ncbi:tryptophanyl-tRNA synthetase [Nematocida sp. LUAm3]|nr:tryptophanyl-tRNA synthetase [Nematocida sp. LUAm3]KAI5173991.1 tryptophanyl-tRNA synthetase [Nematocida sp. LUAm2]KAI5177265.1 tryptophanyl-tRNA synthetase [Nematocida sp. LUAm1]
MESSSGDVINPWEVSSGQQNKEIDYETVIKQFGCERFTKDMAKKYGLDHILFRRGMVFAHRDFLSTVEMAAKGEPVYLYTGRGPSSKSMHLGHAVPFLLCKYLQEKFGCNLVIQMTDDEKYIWKDMTFKEAMHCRIENVKDIISFGFDPRKTFIFSNIEYAHNFLETTLKIEKSIMLKDFMKVFGFTETSKVGQICFPSKQMAPCYPSTFPKFLDPRAQCLIPASIDQDPYFRLARDLANKFNSKKAASIYTHFLPALQGVGTKMSASSSVSSIYLSDTPKEIEKKINKYAFSGGQATLEEHKRLGGNLEVDVSFQYLQFFLESDEELNKYAEGYKNGTILSGQMKKLCISTIQEFVKDFQKRRSEITQDFFDKFHTLDKENI